MILARMRVPEALRHKAPGEQGVLLGLDRCPEVKTLRRKIAQLAASEDTVRDWQRALSRSWLAGEESDRMTLAVDGHVKTYSGRKGRLPRHFISRQKLCLPASVSYWINVMGGKPLICIHKDLDPKTAQAIEHDAVPELEASGIITPDAPDLTRETGEPAVTLVFDREGQRPALFLRLARRGVACITWHKNFQGRDWSREDFRDYEMPVHGPAGRSSATVSLAEKTVSLKNGPEARQIRRRLENGRQVTLITTHPSMPVEEAAGAMFSRWSQENFFKYMRGEFNLDALPAHTLMPLDPCALTVNPARRAADKAAEALRARIRRLSRRILQCRKNGKPCESLDAEAESLENELEELKLRRRRLPARIRAGDLPESWKLDALPVAGRLFLDIIRMIRCRAETRMMPPVAAAQGRKPAPRKPLAALMTADADILPDHENGILRVRILGLARAIAFEFFCFQSPHFVPSRPQQHEQKQEDS